MSIGSIGACGGAGHSAQVQRLTFDKADTDGSGGISLDEFSAIGQSLPGGKNSLDDKSVKSLFSAIDTDGDGEITKAEAKTAHDKLQQAMQSNLLALQEQFGAPPPRPSAQDIFKNADADGDGVLSLEEFKADVSKHRPPDANAPDESKLESRFAAMDSDGSGGVSVDEMTAAFESRPHGHRHNGSGQIDMAALFSQAAAAYSNQNEQSPDMLSQLLDILKAA